MKPSEVFILKKKVLEAFKILLPSAEDAPSSGASIESALASNSDIQKRAFLGYTLNPDKPDDYQLVIQIPRKSGPAYSTAQRFVKEHPDAILAHAEALSVPSKTETSLADRDKVLSTRLDVLYIGASVSHADGDPGTITGIGHLKGEEVLISANHVIACSNVGPRDADIYQPAKADFRYHYKAAASNEEVVANLRKWIPLGKDENEVDCADAILVPSGRPHNGNYAPPNEVVESPVAGKYISLHPEVPVEERLSLLGRRVGKFGRSTGYTEGTILSVFDEMLVNYQKPNIGNAALRGLIAIRWDDGKPFSLPGDSGACVFLLDSMEGVGIHIAGSKNYFHGGTRIEVSLSCYLPTAVRTLGVTWAPNGK